MREHNSESARGAKYVRARKPVTLVYSESFSTITLALQREYEVKQWRKAKKEALVTASQS